jgi:Fe-S-cluster containining protein
MDNYAEFYVIKWGHPACAYMPVSYRLDIHGTNELSCTPYLVMDSEKNRDVACHRCGACCHVDVAAYVTREDIERWEKEGRFDIIAHARANDVTRSGDQVTNRFGSKITTCLMSCVYLKWHGPSSACEIYETRTKVCRNYVPGSSDLCPLYRRDK